MPRHVVFLLLLLSGLSPSTHAEYANFIQQRALDPIKLQTGLPEAASRLHTSSEFQVSLVHNNVFMGGVTANERLLLDGESSQLNLRYRQKLNSCWQFNLSGSVLAHSGGSFDGLVDDFHQFFNLPDAMRNLTPENQLEYTYETANGQQSVNSATQGLGDAQVQIQRSLGCINGAPIVRAGVKLPIGSSERFFGSGAVDAFIDVQTRWRKLGPQSRLQWAASIGALIMGDNEFLAEREPVVGFGVAGVNFSLTPKLTLLGQLDWHTPMFDSELTELGDTAVQLSLGLRLNTQGAGAWEFSFSEDVVVDTSPDIVVRVAWTSRFDALARFK